MRCTPREAKGERAKNDKLQTRDKEPSADLPPPQHGREARLNSDLEAARAEIKKLEGDRARRAALVASVRRPEEGSRAPLGSWMEEDQTSQLTPRQRYDQMSPKPLKTSPSFPSPGGRVTVPAYKVLLAALHRQCAA